MTKSRKLLLIEAILVVGMTIALVHRYQTWMQTGLGYPYSTLTYYQPTEQFADFIGEVSFSSQPYTRGTIDCMYPPFVEAAVNILFVRLLPIAMWTKLCGMMASVMFYDESGNVVGGTNVSFDRLFHRNRRGS